MRIISGTYRGRNIVPPHNFTARPTTDFAKEALFNVIAGNFDFATLDVLDIFAGTGSISYEFASRGCSHIDAVDVNRRHCEFIVKTAQLLGSQQIHCYCRDGFSYLKQCSKLYDIIFADPPYALANIEYIPDIVFEKSLLKSGGWLILEHGKQKDFASHPHFLQHRQYGSVNFSIFGSAITS
ncbi:methyltransferase [Bacteroidia bacterium]|nr:methyltransferase [Bacteroidia bacterium]